MSAAEEIKEAIKRAEEGESLSNYEAIFEGFEAMGIATDDIRPRENVFTYKVWQAKGRQVMKGSHGVRIVTVREYDNKKGERKKSVKGATVFHISQTKEIGGDDE